MHFFSPAHMMPLVECVRGEDSSPVTIAAVMGASKTLKKVRAQCHIRVRAVTGVVLITRWSAPLLVGCWCRYSLLAGYCYWRVFWPRQAL